MLYKIADSEHIGEIWPAPGSRMRDIFTCVTTELNVGTLLINTLKVV